MPYVKSTSPGVWDPGEYAWGDKLAGVPVWERGQFVYGAGPYAPGGPTGGSMVGPMFPGAPGGGGCSEVPGGRQVCVQPRHGPQGAELMQPWPPEIGPEEDSLLDQGCRPTGRRCGGSPRAPAQAWCCPTGMMVGQMSPVGLAGIGEFYQAYKQLILMAGFAVAGYLLFKRLGRPYKLKSRSRVLPDGTKEEVWTMYHPNDKIGFIGTIAAQPDGTFMAEGGWKEPHVEQGIFPTREEAADWLWLEYREYSLKGVMVWNPSRPYRREPEEDPFYIDNDRALVIKGEVYGYIEFPVRPSREWRLILDDYYGNTVEYKFPSFNHLYSWAKKHQDEIVAAAEN
jgi:hypothetical protein